MRLADYVPRLADLAATVHRWLAVAARLDSLRREKVALYAEEIAAALAIEPGHVAGDRVKITKDKYGAGRTAVFSQGALSALKVVMQHNPAYESGRYHVMKIIREAGLDDGSLDTHSLRRTCAQALMDCNIPST